MNRPPTPSAGAEALRPIRPRFANGVALAAAVPYLCLMASFAASRRAAEPHERAFLGFVGTIVALAGVPLFLLVSLAVFGASAWTCRRRGLAGPWPHVIWGAAAFLLLGVALLESRGLVAPRAEDVRILAAVAGVGAAAGAAFWAGAVRSRQGRPAEPAGASPGPER